MKHEKRFALPPLGLSGLLVIFAVLCLTVFSLLALHTVLAEQRLSRAAARSVTEQYAADLRAQEIFARLRAGEMPPEVRAEEEIYSYEVPISDTQTLEVAVTETERGWEILSWKNSAHPEDGDTALPVWQENS